jgi:hypothetical protein
MTNLRFFVLTIENAASTTGGGAAVRAAGA